GYDWNEDHRIRKVADELSGYDREDLWWCLMEHLSDERYSIAFVYNDGLHIASVGGLCWQKTQQDLQSPYIDLVPDAFRRKLRVIGSLPSLKEWYKGHKKVPLYEQQIEIGELMLKKLDDLELYPADRFGP